MSEPYRKKLIEVALPLEAINRESQHEKSVPRRGHPATMHVWWARRPLAACRAVLFASLVDDPSSRPDLHPTEEQQDSERQRLFRLIEELVRWENSANDAVLALARDEIRKSNGTQGPLVVDPFCGGGSIPLEAQRLGLDVFASDLNPIPTLITKALVEIPPRFAGRPPVSLDEHSAISSGIGWKGAAGLAADLRAYGRWLRDEAHRELEGLYPPAGNDRSVTPLAWIWARTVQCPNPACGLTLPLAGSLQLSSKRGRRTWLEPIVQSNERRVRFEVATGDGPTPTPIVDRRGARCVSCGTAVPFDYIRSEASEGRMGVQLIAVVGEGARKRIFMPSDEVQELAAQSAKTRWEPTTDLPDKALGFRVQRYGLVTHAQLFTSRQLASLATFSELLKAMRERVQRDAVAAGMVNDNIPLVAGGSGARAYGEAVATYVAFAIDKLADWNSSLCSWIHSIEGVRPSFPRSAMSMVWDFVETNPFSGSVGNFSNHIEWVAAAVGASPAQDSAVDVRQLDARAVSDLSQPALVVTDPPYYDNVGYASLSDFFYVWLRRSVGDQFPGLFSTVLTPKEMELIAEPARHGGDAHAAKAFFETGLRQAFEGMSAVGGDEFPLCLFYAFKQTESSSDQSLGTSTVSTGWETMLEGLISADLAITGTWPIRTERAARPRQHMSNALASSIVLVCRRRPSDSPMATRREFVAALRAELPKALGRLQEGFIAPVDLAQAAIGPGMAIFSGYSKVLEADGQPMTVRAALGLVNQALDEILVEQEGDFDSDTRFAVTWFEHRGTGEGPYGEADVLARAKDTSVDGMERAGVLVSLAGKVRLRSRAELDDSWDPATDPRLTVWEVTQHLVRQLDEEGESAAADVLRRVGSDLGETARELAYRLYSICERKGWADEALGYNALVVAWPEIARLAAGWEPTQGSLDV